MNFILLLTFIHDQLLIDCSKKIILFSSYGLNGCRKANTRSNENENCYTLYDVELFNHGSNI